jgi:outer membrane biosynthesis protein TonB
MYKRVTSIVISFHLLFMAFLLFYPERTPVKKISHVKVRTVRPMATLKKAPQAASKPAPKPTQKQKSVAPVAKPTAAAKKPAQPNKPAVVEKGKPIKKKAEPAKEIWNEIDQALAKIEKKSYPTSKPLLTLPQPLTFLDEKEAAEDDSAVSQFMGFLHDTLHLPEVGEVRVAITVRKNGTVSKVVILSAESEKNKLYLQEYLPLLQLPIEFDQEKTWTITFCNEI